MFNLNDLKKINVSLMINKIVRSDLPGSPSFPPRIINLQHITSVEGECKICGKKVQVISSNEIDDIEQGASMALLNDPPKDISASLALTCKSWGCGPVCFSCAKPLNMVTGTFYKCPKDDREMSININK